MLDSIRKWIKEPANLLAAALVMISAAVIIGVSVASDNGARSDRPTLPVCVHEDASGQAACFWDASRFGSEHPDAYVFDSGKITYYPHTGELAVWDDEINDVATYKINTP
jgi:hypothetical protein